MKPYHQQTYYELLEVSPAATAEEIRAAYERASQLYAPDSVAIYSLADPAEADELRKRILEAFEYLSEPDLRDDYDRSIGVDPAARKARAAQAPREEAPPASASPGQAPPAAAGPVAPEVQAPPEQLEASAPTEPRAGATERPKPPTPGRAADEASPWPAQLTMQEILSASERPASSYAHMSVSYIPHPPRAESPGFAAKPWSPADGAAVSTPPPRGQGEGAETATRDAAPATTADATSAQPRGADRIASREPEPDRVSKTGRVSAPEPARVSEPAPEPGRVSEPAPEPERVSEPAPEPARVSEPAPEPEPEPEPVRVPEPGLLPEPPAQVRAPPPLPPRGAAPRPPTAPPPPPPDHRLRGPRRPMHGAPEIAQQSAIAEAEAALAQVASKAREPRPKPLEVPPDAEFNGELLRKIRQAKNLSLQTVADRTKISARHLENVEADRYDALPTTVYLRGILMNIAREYGLDPLRVSKSYLALIPPRK